MTNKSKWIQKKVSKKPKEGYAKEIREMRNRESKEKTNNQIADLSPILSAITLTVKGSKDRLSEWIKKHDPTICCHKKRTSNIP